LENKSLECVFGQHKRIHRGADKGATFAAPIFLAFLLSFSALSSPTHSSPFFRPLLQSRNCRGGPFGAAFLPSPPATNEPSLHGSLLAGARERESHLTLRRRRAAKPWERPAKADRRPGADAMEEIIAIFLRPRAAGLTAFTAEEGAEGSPPVPLFMGRPIWRAMATRKANAAKMR